jgi:hypothetical protein
MATRVLGPKGSKKRRRFLFVPILLVALAALLMVGSAQAVHDIGVFELDGNAVNDTAVAGDDWDQVCHQVTIGDDNITRNGTTTSGSKVVTGLSGTSDLAVGMAVSGTGIPSGATISSIDSGTQITLSANATASGTNPLTFSSIPDQCASASNTTNASGLSFVSEPNRSTSIFTGGGSKDDLNILANPGPGTGWEWKDQGGLPDKDNLRDGFAARYTCVTAAGCTGTAGDSLLYFGADRFDNSGDAQIGFWFLQGDVSNLSNGKFGPDAHVDGDILILSDFTQGGGKPTIRIFAWDPDCSSGCNPATDLVDGTLLPLGGTVSSPADCPSVGPGDGFCAVVNSTNATAPWSFTDKSKNTFFAPGELYEGGVNLTKLQETFPGLAGECFASFSSETRSSQSSDAVLKDFIIGSFQPCVSGIQTTPSNSSIVLGGSVTDSAVVTGTGAGTPTGTVKFFVCSPSQLDDPNSTTDNPNTCDTDGTFVDVGGDEPNGKTLTPDQSDPSKANATSDPVTPNAVGTWCFRGEYVPAQGSPYPPSTDSATTECFTVTTVATTTTTRQFVYPQDKAKITASAGGNLAGSVRFRLYDTLANCTADGGTAATGMLYQELGSAHPISGASAQFATTNNTTVAVTSNTTVYWNVFYDSTNPAQDDSGSACIESTQVTYVGNDSNITVP